MNGEGGRKARANSVASLVASGKMSAAEAVVPILAGLSTNKLAKWFSPALVVEVLFLFTLYPDC
jgi:hypothetical protein